MATGLAAGPGAASGKVVFSASKAEEWRQPRRKSCARPHRNQPGRSPRHDRLRRHSHLPRRRFQPCGPGRPANGQSLRRRRWRNSHRLPHRHAHVQRRHASRRRFHQHQRLDRRSVQRRHQHRRQRAEASARRQNARSPAKAKLFKYYNFADEAGRQVPQARHPHQRRSARSGRKRHRVRRRRHRPVPHRAHVLRRRPHHRRARR